MKGIMLMLLLLSWAEEGKSSEEANNQEVTMENLSLPEVNVSKNCGVWNDDVEQIVSRCSFWMEGVILLATGIFGLLGNSLSICILSKPDMFNSFNLLLIALSSMDSIFIIMAILDYSMTRAFSWSSQAFVYSFPFVIYPLNNLSFLGSIFITVALAYERYIAVCRPLHYRDVTIRYSVKRRTLCYLLPVMMVSLVLSIPKFLETKLVWKEYNSTNVSMMGSLEEPTFIASVGVSDFRNDPDYIRYYINWTRLIMTGLVPMAGLIYLNFNIYRGIQMTHERTKRKNKQRASEMNLAVVLFCIVILFLCCHFPRILLNVHEFFMLDDIIVCADDFIPPVWFLCFTSFNHCLLIVNASCNFLIYCSVGAKFKKTVIKLYGNQCLRWCLPTPRDLNDTPTQAVEYPMTELDSQVKASSPRPPNNCCLEREAQQQQLTISATVQVYSSNTNE